MAKRSGKISKRQSTALSKSSAKRSLRALTISPDTIASRMGSDVAGKLHLEYPVVSIHAPV